MLCILGQVQFMCWIIYSVTKIRSTTFNVLFVQPFVKGIYLTGLSFLY